jgi:mgtE-like transporter
VKHVAHVGISSFTKALQETFLAFSFNVLGVIAGFIVASQLGLFRLSPWAIALFPVVLGTKSVLEGLLSGRLSTGLHLGTVIPRFRSNTESFSKLVEALIVVALIASAAMSGISLVFGHFIWGLEYSDFPALLSATVATMAMGLVLFLVTSKVAFFSFKKGLDPDIVLYPIMSNISTILISLFYVIVLEFQFSQNPIGPSTVIILSLFHTALASYLLLRSIHNSEFIKTLKESIITMLFVAVIVNVTGSILKEINLFAGSRKEIYTVYPALIGLISGVGSVVGSTATTKLALGLLKPSLSSIVHHSRNILSAWIASFALFLFVAPIALLVHGVFSFPAFYHLELTLAIANIIAVASIVLVSYAISILTFKRGLNPGNFVIPLESSLSGILISAALFVAIVAIR